MGALILQVACAVCSLLVVSAESLGPHICSWFRAHYHISAVNKKSSLLSAMSDRHVRGGQIKVSNDRKTIGIITAVHEPPLCPNLPHVHDFQRDDCAEHRVLSHCGHDLSIDYLYSVIPTEVSKFDKQGCCLRKEFNLISKGTMTQQPSFPHS